MAKQSKSYQELKKLVDRGRVNFRLILSPPRTGSTLMEAVLSQFEEGQLCCHEPFVELGYYGGNAEDGYQKILTRAREASESGSVNILIKEMSHWLGVNQEYGRFLPLVKDPALVLIRNPLLSLESRLRKVLQVWQMREKSELIAWLQENLGTGGNQETIEAQVYLLDEFASSFGSPSWETLLADRFARQDYQDFGPLLKIEGLFPAASSGWEALGEELAWFRERGLDYMVIDSTEFRLKPQFYSQEIARRWQVRNNGPVREAVSQIDRLEIRMHKPHYRLWYDTLLGSQEIKPPIEPVPNLGMFPKEIKAHLRETAIPVYIQAFTDKRRIKSDKDTISGETVVNGRSRLGEIDPYLTALLDPKRFSSCSVLLGKFIDSETWSVWQECYQSLGKQEEEKGFPNRRK
jgi:hypothetical protein